MQTHHRLLAVISCSILASISLTGVSSAAPPGGAEPFAGFEPPVLYPVGDIVLSVRAGDLDGDGDIDLVTANNFSDDLSLLFNHGDGTFVPEVRIPVADSDRDVAIADWDGDGVVDLIVAFSGISPNGPGGGVAILLGTGGGTFGEPTFYLAGPQPVGVAAGDLDHDGDVDFIVTNQLGGNVAVFLNNGDGTPAPPAFYAVGSVPGPVILADMDLDGDLDAVVSNSFSDNLSLLPNMGDGTFGAQTLTPTPVAPSRSLSVGDIDHDGYPDVAVATGNLGVITVHRNIDGVLGKPEIHYINIIAATAMIAPINDNDDQDVTSGGVAASAMLPPRRAGVQFGDGDGGFTSPAELIRVGNGTQAISTMRASDVDNDGDIDLIFTIRSDVLVLINKTNFPVVGDLTADGVVDGLDLATLLQAWGNSGPADFNHDGVVNGRDLATLLVNWTTPAPVAPTTPQKGNSP